MSSNKQATSIATRTKAALAVVFGLVVAGVAGFGLKDEDGRSLVERLTTTASTPGAGGNGTSSTPAPLVSQDAALGDDAAKPDEAGQEQAAAPETPTAESGADTQAQDTQQPSGGTQEQEAAEVPAQVGSDQAGNDQAASQQAGTEPASEEKEEVASLEPGKTPDAGQSAAPAGSEQPAVTPVPSDSGNAAQEQTAIDPEAPTFDVMRVERDGSLVVAGKAMPGSKVELLQNGEAILSEMAGPSGDWVAVLDRPLAPGDHELSIRTTTPDGAVKLSQETGIARIPESMDGEVLALVTKPGEATRVLQMETPGNAAPAAEPQDSAAAPAGDGTGEPAKPVRQLALVQAVDVEPGKIIVAGKGEPGRRVGVYLDNEYKGTAEIGGEGGFILSIPGELAAGEHSVRIDVLEGGTSEVASRSEVTVLHEPDQKAAGEMQMAAAETADTAQQETPAAPAENGVNAGTASDAAPGASAPASNAGSDNVSGGGSDGSGQVTQPTSPSPSTGESAPAAEGGDASSAAGAQMEAGNSAPAGAASAEGSTAPSDQQQEVSSPSTGDSTPVAQTPATEDSSPVIRTGQSLIIRKGDNLWRVSRRFYGAGRSYTLIYSANRDQIRDPDLIYPGQVLSIPSREEEAPTPGTGGTTTN
jgi:nucleoid-associated protein YgaU